MNTLIRLGELNVGQAGKIISMNETDETSGEVIRRLNEMGILSGSIVTLVHEAPFGRDPIAIQCRGALIALRRSEANLIEVEVSKS